MEIFDYRSSTALITGASRGIGAAIARELATRGVSELILTARSHEDLDALRIELQQTHPQLRVETIPADLSRTDAPEFLKAETDRRGLTVDLLVNNAGFGTYGPFDNLPLNKEASMIQVNVSALVALTSLYLPEMVRRGRGGIINVSSTAAFLPCPYMTTYGATKAFVQSFSEGLWREMRDLDADVRIVCLCPGGTETNFGSAIGVARGNFENAPHSTPEEVAVAGLDALDRGAMYTVVGLYNYGLSFLPRLCSREAVAELSASVLRPADRRRTGSRSALLLGIAGAAAVGAALAAFGSYQSRRRNLSGAS